MGNVLNRCCTTGTKSVRANQRRGSVWHKLLCTCLLGDPLKKRSRLSDTENVSSSYEGPGGEWFSENMGKPGCLDSSKRPKLVKYPSRSRFMSEASIPPPQESPLESPHGNLLAPMEGSHVNSPDSRSSPIRSSCPDMGRKFYNQRSYKQLHAHNPNSRSSPIRSGSQEMTRMPSNQQSYECQLHVNRPNLESHSVTDDSRDLTRMSVNQRCYQQSLHEDSQTSRYIGDSSPDRMRKSYYPQRSPESPKTIHSPRRHSKPGSGKSSRRRRHGMRSPSHRTLSSKSPGRAVSGRIQDNEGKRNGMHYSPSRKTSYPKSLGRILTELSEDKSHDMCLQTSNSKTLRRVLSDSIDENEDLNSNAMRSSSHRTAYSKPPGRFVSGRIQDNESKRNGMRSPSRKTSHPKSLGRILAELEDKDKSYDLCLQTSNSKTLGKALSDRVQDNEGNSNGMHSPSRKASHSTSPGRTGHQWRIQDEEHTGARSRSFNCSQVAVTSPISRRAALALIRGLGNRRNVMRSSELSSESGRKHWKPALQSISEASEWNFF